jgi:pimeloyl-ACP methyl ester carboxylesterase
MKQSTTQTFWNGESRYGLVHFRDKVDPAQASTSLLVFVHGLFGDAKTTWGQMPQWVLENAGLEMDVVSFAYPSRLLQRSNLQQAAEDLFTWLNTEFKDYSHVLFITHSSGGLVVKQMLCQSWQSIQQNNHSENNADHSKSIWYRTRRVINIAVPHYGGTRFSSIGGAIAYRVFYALMAPLLGLVRFLTQGGNDLGKNELIGLVRTRNPQLIALDEEFIAHQTQAMDADALFPVVHDIFAKSDMSVARIEESKGRHPLYVRGTHGSVKIPNRPSGPIVTIIADIIKLYNNELGLTIANQTLLRISAINRMAGTQTLLGSCAEVGELQATQEHQPAPSIATVHYGSQVEVADLVLKTIHSDSEKPRKLLITGPAGVGKSIVLRSITWRAGKNYLADPAPSTALPLFIPLQQMTVHPGEEGLNWDRLWKWWLHWSRDLYTGMQCTEAQLEHLFRNQAITICIDGLVDFVINYPNVGITNMIEMLQDACDRYRANPHFTIIVCARSSFYGIQQMVKDPKDIYEVLRLTRTQAKQLYPNTQSWIDSVEDADLLDVILTPLILANYEPCAECRFQRGEATQASIMCQTIRTILLRSNLTELVLPNQKRATTDHLIHALVLIAWLFFYRSRGEISVDVLTSEAYQAIKRWQNYFALVQQSDPGFYSEQLQDIHEQMLIGFGIVENADTCRLLLEQTLFVPTGANRFRFSHRSWQEYLLAQYLVTNVRTHHFEELGYTAYHSRIYKLAGEAFPDQAITEPCIAQLLTTWEKTHNTYISGNVIAFLSWTHVALDVPALTLLLEVAPQLEMLPRLVLFAGFGYRVLSNDEYDYCVSEIRRALAPKLELYSNPQTALLDDPVLSSLAWCYQKAFAEKYATQQPATDWVELNFCDEMTYKALPMICTNKDNRWILDERSKSLQYALLVPVQESSSEVKLAIRAVHYLYYLVVARKHGVHVLQLNVELPHLLATGSRFESMVESFTSVPEVLTLYRRCQSFHENLVSVAA